jgi:carbonic anhydrase/acetyltransferase-like protein (isoleucine patch superfamily)
MFATLSNNCVVGLRSAIEVDAVVPATSDAGSALEISIEGDRSILILGKDDRAQESGNS